MADSFFFFFQAEDGIRDLTVTGVQTCALPICGRNVVAKAEGPIAEHQAHGVGMPPTPVSCRGHAFVLPNIISRTASSPDHPRHGERDGSETDPPLTLTLARVHED